MGPWLLSEARTEAKDANRKFTRGEGVCGDEGSTVKGLRVKGDDSSQQGRGPVLKALPTQEASTVQHSRTNAWECRIGRGNSLGAQSVWKIPVRHNQGSTLGSPPHNPHQQKRSFHQRRQDSSGWQLLPSEQRSSCAGLHGKRHEC